MVAIPSPLLLEKISEHNCYNRETGGAARFEVERKLGVVVAAGEVPEIIKWGSD